MVKLTIASLVGGKGGRDRGPLAGGVMMLLISLFAVAGGLFAPLWLVESVSEDGSVCSRGTGLWISEYFYGDDVPTQTPCSGSTSWTVCEVASADYNQKTCDRLTATRVLLIGTLMLSFVSLCLGVRGLESGIKKWFAHTLARGAAFSAAGAGVVGLIGFFLFWTSDVFGTADDKTGKYGCFIQAEITENDGVEEELRCVGLGPSFFMGGASCICALIGSSLFFLAAIDWPHSAYLKDVCCCGSSTKLDLNPARKRDKKSGVGANASLLGADEIYLPPGVPSSSSGDGDLDRDIEGADDDDIASITSEFSVFTTPGLASPSMGFGRSATLLADSEEIVGVNDEGGRKLEREHVYSLFTACSRQAVRNHHEASFSRAFFTVSLVGFALPFIVLVNYFLGLWGLDSTLSSINVDIEVADPNLGFNGRSVSIFELTLFTALSAFSDAKAWFVAIFICCGSGIVPILTVACIFYTWFTPLTESTRGITLRTAEGLLKFALFSTYLLPLMEVTLYTEVNEGVIDVLIVSNPEIGTILFASSVIVALVLVRIMITVHLTMQDRRRARHIALRTIANRATMKDAMGAVEHADDDNLNDFNEKPFRSLSRSEIVTSELRVVRKVELALHEAELEVGSNLTTSLCNRTFAVCRTPITKKDPPIVDVECVDGRRIEGSSNTTLISDQLEHQNSFSYVKVTSLGAVLCLSVLLVAASLIVLGIVLDSITFESLPLAHIFSLVILWAIPLPSLTTHRRVLAAAEWLGAMSSLDAFIIIVAAYVGEMDLITPATLEYALPKLVNELPKPLICSAGSFDAKGFVPLVFGVIIARISALIITAASRRSIEIDMNHADVVVTKALGCTEDTATLIENDAKSKLKGDSRATEAHYGFCSSSIDYYIAILFRKLVAMRLVESQQRQY